MLYDLNQQIFTVCVKSLCYIATNIKQLFSNKNYIIIKRNIYYHKIYTMLCVLHGLSHSTSKQEERNEQKTISYDLLIWPLTEKKKV